MKNKLKSLPIVFTIISLILSCYFFIEFKLFSNNKLSAKDIFNKDKNSIVELMAHSIDIGESYGSGIIYNEKGLILTNSHIICYLVNDEIRIYESLYIRFSTEENYRDVTLIKNDFDNDLAILQITNTNNKYQPITFSSMPYTFGDIVYAIGNTSNYGISISPGLISGGARVNEKGNLIGITTFRTKDSSNDINYGFAYCTSLEVINEFIS